MNERLEPGLRELWQSLEKGKLRFWSWCGCREPVPEIRLAMDPKRRAERVTAGWMLASTATCGGMMDSTARVQSSSRR
jgi:hypothetical protein